jgi:hypothetical protein
LTNATADTTSGNAACITALPNTTAFYFGWPSSTQTPFTITPGLTYTFTFDAWANAAGVSIGAKIGAAATPFTTYATGTELLTTVKSSYQVQFTATMAEPPAGIVFEFMDASVTVCVTNVVVTAQ